MIHADWRIDWKTSEATSKDPKFIRLYKCCYYKFININTPTININYHKINIFHYPEICSRWAIIWVLRCTIFWNVPTHFSPAQHGHRAVRGGENRWCTVEAGPREAAPDGKGKLLYLWWKFTSQQHTFSPGRLKQNTMNIFVCGVLWPDMGGQCAINSLQ